MNLSVAEVAQAVGRTETFVRQHIHRKHLVASKEGRNVYIPQNEAIRWARKRGLKIELPKGAHSTPFSDKNRVARIVVFTLEVAGAQPENLFTLIRHRRMDSLGPWASKPDETWISEKLGHGICEFSLDAPLYYCQSLVDNILNGGLLKIEGNEILFSLESTPRRYWAYRDQRPIRGKPPVSPFKNYSAEIVEYWNLSHQLQEEWQGILSEIRDNSLQEFGRLGFSLDRHSERAGNLMIAAAADTIKCSLASNHNNTLNFHVDADEVQSINYQATAWASHCDDQVFRKVFPVAPGSTTFDLKTDIDHIGFAVYREIDGQCIDLNEMYLVKEVPINMTLVGGPNLEIHNYRDNLKHQSNLSVIQSTINVNLDREATALDRTIRQHWLSGRAWNRERELSCDRSYARFQPDQFDKAIEFFLGLLYIHSEQKELIYFADPYFMHTDIRKDRKLMYLYKRMFEATQRHDLRILCAPRRKVREGQINSVESLDPVSSHAQERANRKKQRQMVESLNPISSHVQVRSFQLLTDNDRNRESTGVFHDRYLITPEQEIIITHSISGWAKNGVTFAKIPYNVYRDEAEWLWSLEAGNQENRILMNKIV